MSATYDFLTALKALTEGRCKAIKPFGDSSHIIISEGSRLVFSMFKMEFVSFDVDKLLGQWTLVDEKSEPVPWSKPEHVPVNCWVRKINGNDHRFIMHVVMEGVHHGCNSSFYKWCELEQWEYSTDRINWKPCTVEFK